MANVATADDAKTRPMTGEEKKVIFASSLGTVFEWYDFYLYGSLAVYIGATFFSSYPETTRNIFALLAFAAGFLVRPFGALVFGRLGDLVGRKYTFLVTILIMGLSTFLVGILPGAASIGIAAPILLIVLRMLQGLALGGEYGGAATYVAEHAPNGRRGYFTSWIQTTATLGLFLSLVVILLVQFALGKEAFAAWGWRIPFLLSCVLLGISVWIRLKMNEFPAFKKMKEEGKGSKAPLSEAFGQWKNAKIALLALFGAVVGQAVVWYSGQFYALFFLTGVLKVDGQSANIMVAVSLLLGTGFFVFFGWLSDKIGRKPIIMAGLLLAMLTYFPLFKALTWAGNPALAQAQATVRQPSPPHPETASSSSTRLARRSSRPRATSQPRSSPRTPCPMTWSRRQLPVRRQRSRSAKRRSTATTPLPQATVPRLPTAPSKSRPTWRCTMPATRWFVVRQRFRN